MVSSKRNHTKHLAKLGGAGEWRESCFELGGGIVEGLSRNIEIADMGVDGEGKVVMDSCM